MTFLLEWAVETWELLFEAAPWLVGGFLMAGVIYVVLPAEKIVSHLGRPGLGGVVKASLAGIPLPLCSCSVIPVASSLRQRGASRGATASFLISTPETGIDSFAISYALLGPFLAVLRPIAALATALTAGCLIIPFDKVTSAQQGSDDHTTTGGCGTCSSEAAAPEAVTFTGKVGQALRYGLVEMFANLSHWLLLGFLLAGLVSAMVPDRFFEELIGSGLGTMLLMVVAGLPLYICATSSTPVAAALIAKGLSPGAALVFLLVGPATNIATMVIVARDLGRKSLAVYLLCIVAVSVLFGLGADAMLAASPKVESVVLATTCSCPAAIAWPSAIALTLLIINGLRLRVFGSKSDS